MSRQEIYVLQGVQLYQETDKAILIGPPGLKKEEVFTRGKTWIPSSLVSHNTLNGIGSIGDVEIPHWFADKQELIDD